MLWERACIIWAVMAAAMIANGVARERILARRLDDLRAHQASCITGALLILAITWAALPWLGLLEAPRAQWSVGALWLALTIAFEFLFGHWVAGHSWARLLQDYELHRGRLWIGVLLVTLSAPRLAGLLHGRAA